MYAIVDIETTGGHAAVGGVTEIAIYVHDGVEVIDRYTTLVKPRQPIPYFIQRLTGISNEMVADAPVFEEIAEAVFDILKDKVFVAHNVNFDYSFLKHHLAEAGFELNQQKLCTVRLSRAVFEGLPSYSLGNICRHLGIAVQNRHRAVGDAEATVSLLEMLLKNGAEKVQQFLKKASKEQYLPLHLPKTQIEQLPDKPGVYYFRNQKGKVIYVGKALRLRKRVISHFSNNKSGPQKQAFAREVHRVDYTTCGSELMAAVLEEVEIKRLWPPYNTSRKNKLAQYALYGFEDQRGYMRLAIDKKKKNLKAIHTFGLLWEGYKMLWKMIEGHQLSPALCFVDKSGEIEEDILPPEKYNVKVESALKALQTALPSFVIMQDGIKAQERACILVENGQFYGMGYIPLKAAMHKIEYVKKWLTPYPDNDFIRDMLYRYAETNPQHMIGFNEN